MPDFCHLHCHTQFSLLDGAAKINNLISKTKQMGMHALAITDHGNMFGVPQFVSSAKKEGIKPIIGCEFYIAQDMHNLKDKKRYHQVLLAKNEEGYKNLSRLSSMGFIEGYYYKPRIDKKLIRKYAKGLIATTCCLAGEVPRAIIEKGEEEAEKLFLEWLSIFEEDYYIELQRHGIEEQEQCNEVLIRWSKKHNVKVIATNDVHYIGQEDSMAQDILLCLQTGKDYDDPNRMRFENDQFYLKSPEEMSVLFQDIPEALDNTAEVMDKVSTLSLERDILLPIYSIPENFSTQDLYLKHLAFEGAKKRYSVVTDEIEKRLSFELEIIQEMGFPGYFLIVQDFINAAREMDVIVGPGRGSAAGSAVAYCIGITNIDPLAYNLLFERFLNPERISMPDIDIDFDDRGRQKVIDYVVDKYGRNQVAQIITFGSMAAKSSIRDVARVLGVPLTEADRMAKLVPDKPGTSLAQAFKEVEELAQLKKEITSPQGKVLSFAETLEGSARHTGIHAAGVIIAPDDLLQHIPVKTDKETDLFITQYDGAYVESVGMLKMDFLGLKTLTIIKDTIELVKKNHSVIIDIDQIPMDDTKTFALYQKGDTIGTFQFESEGMRQWLVKLKPTHVEDLIAMNALYRPGPMQFIPNYIDRKHGKEAIDYPHPLLEDILKNTYGIMVYQEQIMQTAQILAGYTLGQADILRRAMGKKKMEEMNRQKEIFVKGAKDKHNIEREKAEEVFTVMEKFAQYGFNRSHSAAYSVVAYQTGYLKANYPAEYMASVLTHNKNNIDKVTFFMDEAKRQEIKVLGPDINESNLHFDVNKEGQIRFGLGAIKGTGEAAVEAIIIEREEKGAYASIFDFAKRVNLRSVNKKTFESLAMAGAFDCFKSFHRKQYLYTENGDSSLIEKAIRYGSVIQNEKNTKQQSLFGDQQDAEIPLPKIADCEPFMEIEKLKIEKEVVGFYISGHPLDQFQLELKSFCTCYVDEVKNFKGRDIAVAGVLSKAKVKYGKTGKPFGLFTIEDYHDTLDMALFGEAFLKNQHMLNVGEFVFVQGKVQERYGQEGVWELRPHTIQLLSEIRDKMCQGICINIMVEKMNSQLVSELEAITNKHPGKCLLKLKIIDKAENLSVETLSRKFKVSATNELIEAVEELPGVTYAIF